VTWVTRDQLPSSVQYGQTTGGPYLNSANGTTFTYNVGVDGWNGWIHQVTVTELSTSTTYFYICGSAENWSDEFSFTTGPSKPSPTQVYKFAVMGDMGTTIPMGWAVTDQMIDDNENLHFNLVIHVGDVAYAGTGSEWEIEEVWDVWESLVQPIAANIPYMFAPGNHEHYYNWTAYNHRFLMPGAQSGGNANFWYSIDYGNVHFLFFLRNIHMDLVLLNTPGWKPIFKRQISIGKIYLGLYCPHIVLCTAVILMSGMPIVPVLIFKLFLNHSSLNITLTCIYVDTNMFTSVYIQTLMVLL